MMSRYVVSLAALLVSAAAPAAAADLPTAKPAPMFTPVPVFNWTGFYIGLNAGVAWNNSGSVSINDPVNGPHSYGFGSHAGFIGGGQLGYNYQTGQWVFGIESDIQGVAGGGGSVNVGPYGFLHLSSSGNGGWLGTTRARVGYAIDRTLLYVTGGVAYGGLNGATINGGNATSNVGWTIGGGVEYAFAQHWTAKLEALYVNLNAEDHTRDITAGGLVYPVTSKSGNGGGIVRAGVNYLF